MASFQFLLFVICLADSYLVAIGDDGEDVRCTDFEFSSEDELKKKLKDFIYTRAQEKLRGVFPDPSLVITTSVSITPRTCVEENQKTATPSTPSTAEGGLNKELPNHCGLRKVVQCGTNEYHCPEGGFIHVQCKSSNDSEECCGGTVPSITAKFAEECELKERCSLSGNDFQTCADKDRDGPYVLYQCNSKETLQKRLQEEGWYRASNDRLYKLFSQTTAYKEAKSNCSTHGGKLAAEGMRNSTIRSDLAHRLNLTEKVWIGLEKQGNDWRWSDGVMNETSWYAGEPDNQLEPENCGVNNGKYGMENQFIDVRCDKELPHLCEIDLSR